MGKLHELLAVEGDIEKTAKSIMGETTNVFNKNQNLFIGRHRSLQMFDDDMPGQADEVVELTTTVPERLEYTGEHIASWLDVSLNKEATNQIANADLVVDGNIIAAALPATFLLGLENKLKQLLNVYKSIPTLQAGVAWERDATIGNHVYKQANPNRKNKTQKTFNHKVLYEATDKHPAQIEKWEEQRVVGEYTEQIQSGMMSSSDKNKLLNNVEKLLRATKTARMQANSVEATKLEVGNEIVKFINNTKD